MGAFSLYFLILLFANGPIHVNSAHAHHLEEESENSFCEEFKAYIVPEIYFKISNYVIMYNISNLQLTEVFIRHINIYSFLCLEEKTMF